MARADGFKPSPSRNELPHRQHDAEAAVDRKPEDHPRAEGKEAEADHGRDSALAMAAHESDSSYFMVVCRSFTHIGELLTDSIRSAITSDRCHRVGGTYCPYRFSDPPFTAAFVESADESGSLENISGSNIRKPWSLHFGFP
jgi:hypothetical protein